MAINKRKLGGILAGVSIAGILTYRIYHQYALLKNIDKEIDKMKEESDELENNGSLTMDDFLGEENEMQEPVVKAEINEMQKTVVKTETTDEIKDLDFYQSCLNQMAQKANKKPDDFDIDHVVDEVITKDHEEVKEEPASVEDSVQEDKKKDNI